MKKEFIAGVVAMVAQISGLISILAIISIFFGAADGLAVLIITGPVFVISFLATWKLKGGLGWLVAWSFPWPF